MGCGASKKTRPDDLVVLNGTVYPKSPGQNITSDETSAHTSDDKTSAAMFRKANSTKEETKASVPNQNASEATNALEKKIRTILSIPEEDIKEALSVAAKHPDHQGDFIHLVNIMHKVVRNNPEEFVTQLNSIKGSNLLNVPDSGKQLIDFLALIGGATATAEIYADHLKKMGVSHLTDEHFQEEEEEGQQGEAMYIVILTRHFWENATDCSLEFGGRLAETSAVAYMVEDLKNLDKNFPADSSLFDDSLTLLHNCARNKQRKQRFRDLGLVQLLTTFLDREEKAIKLLSLLTLSYVIDEEDNHLLFADASDFDFLLEALAAAWSNKHHRNASGYTLEELLQGLGNLAQNEDNKTLLMEKDVLMLLKPILASGSDAEKQEAAQIVWNLAFNKENRSKMKDDKELTGHLEKLKGSDHKGVAKSSSGALWVLSMDQKVQREAEGSIIEQIHQSRALKKGVQSPPPPPPSPPLLFGGIQSPSPPPSALGQAAPPSSPAPLIPSLAGGEGKGHVMISYQWGNQKMIVQVRNDLRSRGFQVWMDIDNISGSTLQAMAEAVEKSEAVLMCMSQRYKDSPNCRTEAEYAFALKKPIIPLLMERNYQPDGWLGILKGSKLFFDFSGKYPYEKKLEELIKELGQRGRGQGDSSEVDGPIAGEKVAPVASTPTTNTTSVSAWTQKDVRNWLNKHQLSGCSKLQSLSGENIKFLQKLSHRAPEFFYSYLKQDLGLTSLNDLMHFSDAIDILP